MEKKNVWETYDAKHLKKLESLNQEYRNFLDTARRNGSVLAPS